MVWFNARLISLPGFVTGLITARLTGQWGREDAQFERLLDLPPSCPKSARHGLG